MMKRSVFFLKSYILFTSLLAAFISSITCAEEQLPQNVNQESSDIIKNIVKMDSEVTNKEPYNDEQGVDYVQDKTTDKEVLLGQEHYNNSHRIVEVMGNHKTQVGISNNQEEDKNQVEDQHVEQAENHYGDQVQYKYPFEGNNEGQDEDLYEDFVEDLPDDIVEGLSDDIVEGLPDDTVGGLPDDIVGLPDDFVEGKPDETIEGLPNDIVEGLPDDIVGLPDDIIAGLPDDIVAGLPDDIVAGLPDDIVEGKPDETVEDQRYDTVEDQRYDTVEDQRDDTVEGQRYNTIEGQLDDTVDGQLDDTVEGKRDETINGQEEEELEKQNEENAEDQYGRTQDQNEGKILDQNIGKMINSNDNKDKRFYENSTENLHGTRPSYPHEALLVDSGEIQKVYSNDLQLPDSFKAHLEDFHETLASSYDSQLTDAHEMKIDITDEDQLRKEITESDLNRWWQLRVDNETQMYLGSFTGDNCTTNEIIITLPLNRKGCSLEELERIRKHFSDKNIKQTCPAYTCMDTKSNEIYEYIIKNIKLLDRIRRECASSDEFRSRIMSIAQSFGACWCRCAIMECEISFVADFCSPACLSATTQLCRLHNSYSSQQCVEIALAYPEVYDLQTDIAGFLSPCAICYNKTDLQEYTDRKMRINDMIGNKNNNSNVESLNIDHINANFGKNDPRIMLTGIENNNFLNTTTLNSHEKFKEEAPVEPNAVKINKMERNLVDKEEQEFCSITNESREILSDCSGKLVSDRELQSELVHDVSLLDDEHTEKEIATLGDGWKGHNVNSTDDSENQHEDNLVVLSSEKEQKAANEENSSHNKTFNDNADPMVDGYYMENSGKTRIRDDSSSNNLSFPFNAYYTFPLLLFLTCSL